MWSPTENVLLYSAVGKTSGSLVWRLYNPQNKSDIMTLFYGQNILPVWSYDGEYVTYQKKNQIIILDSAKNKTTIDSSVSSIETLSWAPDSLKIVYAGDNKIFLYDLASRNTAFMSYGRNPYFLGNNLGLIYTDDDFELYFINSKGEKDILLDNIDEYVVSKNSSFFVACNETEHKFIIYNLLLNATNSFSYKGNFSGFDIDFNNKYLLYAVDSGIYAYNILSKEQNQIFKEGIYPKFSFNNTYISYELQKIAKIIDMKDVQYLFPVREIYTISIGKNKGLKRGDILGVYEEKVNPFSNAVIGYDNTQKKTTVKIISVYDDFSLAEKENKGEKIKLEVNDAVVKSDQITFGYITKIEK